MRAHKTFHPTAAVIPDYVLREGDWDGAMVIGVRGIGIGGTPIGQRVDVTEFSEEGTEVVDVTEMTLPMESGRFRSVVLGPDGSLYTAVDEGMIQKLTPGN